MPLSYFILTHTLYVIIMVYSHENSNPIITETFLFNGIKLIAVLTNIHLTKLYKF